LISLAYMWAVQRGLGELETLRGKDAVVSVERTSLPQPKQTTSSPTSVGVLPAAQPPAHNNAAPHRTPPLHEIPTRPRVSDAALPHPVISIAATQVALRADRRAVDVMLRFLNATDVDTTAHIVIWHTAQGNPVSNPPPERDLGFAGRAAAEMT